MVFSRAGVAYRSLYDRASRATASDVFFPIDLFVRKDKEGSR